MPQKRGGTAQSVARLINARQYSPNRTMHRNVGTRADDLFSETFSGIERFGLRNPKYKIKKHSTLAEYKAALGEVQFGDLYKFTCVRNPWDRMVSYYFTPTQNMAAWDRKKFRKAIVKALSVADYLRLDKVEEDPFGNVDYVMRFENLADDFRTVCGTLGISPTTLPRYNRSSREHYSKYYDDELRELVRARFAAEIEHFGYIFERQ